MSKAILALADAYLRRGLRAGLVLAARRINALLAGTKNTNAREALREAVKGIEKEMERSRQDAVR